MCCDNPIDLGCVNSCENITTNIVVSCSNSYTIHYEFNGAVINYTMQANSGYLTIPAGIFNEDYSTTFQIKDTSGQIIGCYKVNISPSIVSPLQVVNDVLNSHINLEMELCEEGVPTSLQPVNVSIVLNDSSLLQAGSTIALDLNLDPSLIFGFTSLNTNAYTVTAGPIITIVNIDEIVNNTINLLLNIVVETCNTSFEGQLSVSCFSNLPSTTLIGLQTPSNIIIK